MIIVIVLTTLFLESSFSTSLHFDRINELGQSKIFIPSLLEKLVVNFHNCEFVYVKENTKFHDENSFGNFNFSKQSANSAGVFTVSVGVNITYPRHKDIHRHIHDHCSLAVIYLQQVNHEIETWLINTLIPRYGPILRKDQDHFVLVLPNGKSVNQLLLSPRFGSKIKYKLAVYNEVTSISCTTVDLYGDGGNSKLKVLRTFSHQDLTTGQIDAARLFPDWTTNFHGKVFRFAIPKVAFRFEIEQRADGKYHPKRGFYKWWLDEAMQKFNFTYDIFWASFGGGTGKRLENGTWVGATGDIFYGKADCSFIVGEIYSRHKFLGWSSSISYEWVIFMTHRPRNSYSPKAIFKPFTPLVWCLFFLTLVVMTLAFKFVTMMVAVDPENPHSNWRLMQMLEFMFSTLLEQDPVCPLKTHSIRLLCAFWLIYALITATVFRGKLVSLIAFPVDTWVPTTFEELANSHFKVALNVVGKAGAAYVLIATSTSPVFKTLTARMELIPEAENCLERAMREDLGCIIWKGIADYAMVKNLTDKHGRVPLQESSQIALFIGDGLVYERRAIFGEHLDRTIQAVVQMGLTIKWFQLDQQFIKTERGIWEKSSNVSQATYDYDDGPKKLVVSQFTGLFLLCIVGFVISSGQLVFEIKRHKGESAHNNDMHVGGVGGSFSIATRNEDLHATRAKEMPEVLRFIEKNNLVISKHNPDWHYT